MYVPLNALSWLSFFQLPILLHIIQSPVGLFEFKFYGSNFTYLMLKSLPGINQYKARWVRILFTRKQWIL